MHNGSIRSNGVIFLKSKNMVMKNRCVDRSSSKLIFLTRERSSPLGLSSISSARVRLFCGIHSSLYLRSLKASDCGRIMSRPYRDLMSSGFLWASRSCSLTWVCCQRVVFHFRVFYFFKISLTLSSINSESIWLSNHLSVTEPHTISVLTVPTLSLNNDMICQIFVYKLTLPPIFHIFVSKKGFL